MLEKDFEKIIIKYPEIIEDGLKLIKEQGAVCGRRFDLMFEDKFGQKLIIELKRGSILDKHIGQILYYEGSQLSAENQAIRIMLVGNRVPPSIQRALDYHGIAWREITIPFLIKYLSDKNDQEFLELIKDEAPLAEIKQEDKKEKEIKKEDISKKIFDDTIYEGPINYGDKIEKINYHSFFKKLVDETFEKIGVSAQDFRFRGNANYCQLPQYKSHFEWWLTSGRGKREVNALQVALHFEGKRDFNEMAIATILTEEVKQELEKRLGREVVSGKWSDTRNSWTAIYVVENTNIFTPELLKWAVDSMVIFYEILSPRIQLLRK